MKEKMRIMKEKRKAIGVYTLSNTGGLAIYEIDNADDRVLVGLVTDKAFEPEWCEMTSQLVDNNELTNGFMWGELFIPFSEVMRVGKEESDHGEQADV